MKMDGIILEINPVSVYEDRIRTQNVRIRSTDGTVMTVFDPKKKCSKREIGSDAHLQVFVNSFAAVEDAADDECGIVPAPKEQGPYADIYGRLTNIYSGSSKQRTAIDFNGNEIELDLSEYQAKQFEGFSTGDRVHLKNAKLYLDNIKLIE